MNANQTPKTNELYAASITALLLLGLYSLPSFHLSKAWDGIATLGTVAGMTAPMFILRKRLRTRRAGWTMAITGILTGVLCFAVVLWLTRGHA